MDTNTTPPNPTTYKSIIISGTATLAVLFMLFAYGIGLFAFFFPGTMIPFMQRLGNNNAAAMMAHRAYISNPTQANRLRALDTFITANQHNRVITFATNAIEYEGQGIIEEWVKDAYINSRLHQGHYKQAIDFLTQGYDISLEQITSDNYLTALKRPCDRYLIIIAFALFNDEEHLINPHRQTFREDFINYTSQLLTLRNTIYAQNQLYYLTPNQIQRLNFFFENVVEYTKTL